MIDHEQMGYAVFEVGACMARNWANVYGARSQRIKWDGNDWQLEQPSVQMICGEP